MLRSIEQGIIINTKYNLGVLRRIGPPFPTWPRCALVKKLYI